MREGTQRSVVGNRWSVVRVGRIKAAARQLACDLTLESGVLVSVFVADPSFIESHHGYSFIETVQQEGVRV